MSTDKNNFKLKIQYIYRDKRLVWGTLAISILSCIILYAYYNKTSVQDLSIPGQFAGERKTVVLNRTAFTFRWCPAGSYQAGSPESEPGRAKDEIQHEVILTNGFWALETEVTQKQWKAIMGSNPSCFKGDNLPVEQVSWEDCQEFCNKCKELGLSFQLPTDSQWEYACRAGSSKPHAGALDEMVWYWDNSNGKTQQVKTKKPNAWGLYDMHGNVREWCKDWYGEYPNQSVTNPTGPSDGAFRIIRGGSWNRDDWQSRSAHRSSENPKYRFYDLGFRVVMPITSADSQAELKTPAAVSTPTAVSNSEAEQNNSELPTTTNQNESNN